MEGYKQIVGQYINIYKEDTIGHLEIDVYIVLCESEPEVTVDQIEKATEIVMDYYSRPTLDKSGMESELEDLFQVGIVEIFHKGR